MDIRQLKYFMAIAEEGQITSAAKKLQMGPASTEPAAKAPGGRTRCKASGTRSTQRAAH